MKTIKSFLLLTACCTASLLSAQTYQLIGLMINPTSKPMPVDGLIKITETDLYFSIFDAEKKDTTITKQRIAKNKGKGYYIKTIEGNIAHNYTFLIGATKDEKQQKIYYIESQIVYPDGRDKTIYFRAKLID
ncbi:MAG: hypothetical protein NBV77_08590 [Bacteroidia bacterium]|nr:hypothetical protein [Bacteroidia bacterium]